MVCKYVLLLTFLNEPELIIFWTQLNGFKYCYLTLIIQFNIIPLHTRKWFEVLLFITNNSIKHQSFVYKKLNDQTVLFLTIQFCISHLFELCLKVTVLFDP